MFPIKTTINASTTRRVAQFQCALWLLVVEEEEVAGLLLLHVLHGLLLVDARPMALVIAAEGDLELLQEAVHAIQERLRTKHRRVTLIVAIDKNCK